MSSATTPPGHPASGDFALHAWVDESIHTDAGLYVLASAVADPSTCEPTRDALRDLVISGGRLHWRDEAESLRRKITETITGCDLMSMVVVGVNMASGQERARRRCLEHLLCVLDHQGVTQVWLESRTTSLTSKDMHLVTRLRGQRRLSPGLRVDTLQPSVEPMLWVPDAIAGAVAGHRKGTVLEHRQALGALVEEIDLPL